MTMLLLICAYMNEATVIQVTEDTRIRNIHQKLAEKWSDLQQRQINVYYLLPEEPRWLIATDEDIKLMLGVAASYNTQRIHIQVEGIPIAQAESANSTQMNMEMIHQQYPASSTSTLARYEEETDSDMNMEDYAETMALMYETTICTGESSRLTTGWDNILKQEGQRFKRGAKEFREVLQKLSVETNYKYNYTKNSEKRITAICKENKSGCPWKVHATLEEKTGHFILKKLNELHTCGTDTTHSGKKDRLTSKLIAKQIGKKVRANPGYSGSELMKSAVAEFGREMSYKVAWSAVNKARDELYGDLERSFNSLPAYVEALRETNKESVVKLEVNTETRRFERLFIAFSASIKGFQHCRPLLFLDGTHLKFKQHGHLLAATGKDGNNGM